jgi:hypothetical protein
MQGRSLLFIGYSLEDWNVRVILSKLLRTNRQGDLNYWAIVRGRADTERRIWKRKGLEIYPVDLLRFSDRLVAELDRRC